MTFVSSAVMVAGREGWEGPGPWWPVFPLLWLLLVAGIITAVVLVARRRHDRAGARAGEARLAERFAAGQITAEEYRERRAILREQR